jgi:hypothetical protein
MEDTTMFRSQIFGGHDPQANVHAQVGDVAHADAQVGGGHGNILTANIDGLGINADADVNAAGHGNVIDATAFLGLGGPNTDVEAHAAVGSGTDAGADVGLDGALIHAAASVDPSISAHVGVDGIGDCGCSDTSTSVGANADVDANVSIPDIGLGNPLSLSSLDLSGIDLFCGDHT